MGIIYYTFCVFMAGLVIGLFGALLYAREGRYMGTVSEFHGKSVEHKT